MELGVIFEFVANFFKALMLVSALLCSDKIIYCLAAFLPGKRFADASTNFRYAILVPARNESKVIESLLKSIAAQTYPSELVDIFVVVESADDPTVEICSKYNAHVTVRKQLHLKGKGYALDELLADMYEKGYKNKYDAYFVFDADNYLTPTYIEEMNKVYNAGYHIALGYRNSKNWNDGWVAANSALTFSMLNTFHNKLNSRIGGEMILSGTGFFIDAKVIDSLGGWKFYCITEDVELSYFSALNNLKSTYCPAAEFYDEQPTKFRVSSKQRTRWLKGYFQASKKYQRRIISSAIKEREGRTRKLSHLLFVVPIIFLVVSAALYTVFSFGMGIYAAVINDALYKEFIFAGVSMLIYIYIALMAFNLLLLLSELKYIDISPFNAFKTIALGPIFLFWYLPIFVKILFKKEVVWEAIEHNISFCLKEKQSQECDNDVQNESICAEHIHAEETLAGLEQ